MRSVVIIDCKIRFSTSSIKEYAIELRTYAYLILSNVCFYIR